MRLARRHLWYAVAATAAGLLLWRLLRPARVSVDVTRAAVGSLVVVVGEEGQTQVRRRHVITAPLPGRVDRIGLEPGDSVRPRMVVARLAPVPLDVRGRQQAEAALEAALDQRRVADAAVAQAGTALEQARLDRGRAERLATQNLIAPAELERLQLTERSRQRELEAAEYRAKAAAHQLEISRFALTGAEADGAATERRLELRSSVHGRVLSVPEHSERTVLAGEILLELGDPADLEIVVDLLSTDAVKVAPGDRMLIGGWGGGQVLEGRVRRVEPSGFTKISALGVEEQRVNVVGELVDPPGRLGDRFRVDVRIVLWEADSVLRVPSSALFRRGDRWAVFIVERGRARERVVTVGHESATETEILEGLDEGTLVVRHPTDRVHDGVRIGYPPLLR